MSIGHTMIDTVARAAAPVRAAEAVAAADPLRPVFHFRLHLFYDKSLMELFINDGLQTVTRVAIPPSPALHLEAAATSGAATLRAMTVWPVKPFTEIWP